MSTAIYSVFFLKYTFLDRLVETDRKQEGMTCRIELRSAGFEPGSPAAKTVASTHGMGALPTELCSIPQSMDNKIM